MELNEEQKIFVEKFKNFLKENKISFSREGSYYYIFRNENQLMLLDIEDLADIFENE